MKSFSFTCSISSLLLRFPRVLKSFPIPLSRPHSGVRNQRVAPSHPELRPGISAMRSFAAHSTPNLSFFAHASPHQVALADKGTPCIPDQHSCIWVCPQTSRRSHPTPRWALPSRKCVAQVKSPYFLTSFSFFQPTRELFLLHACTPHLQASSSTHVSATSMFSSSRFDQLRHRVHFSAAALTILLRNFPGFHFNSCKFHATECHRVRCGSAVTCGLISDDLLRSDS